MKNYSFRNMVSVIVCSLYTSTVFSFAISFDELPKGCETPASLACVYGLVPPTPGCPIKGTRSVPTGGWGTIALVENCHKPSAADDLNVFSAKFGLPACPEPTCFRQINFPQHPAVNECTSNEYALDIEWAHAMAPHAKILMVTADGSRDRLLRAVQYAANIVASEGGGLVSLSYGEPEFAGETNYDKYFQTPGVVHVVSSGDSAAGARYPASSPYVIAAGGTDIVRDAQGNFVKETAYFDPNFPPGQKGRGGSGGPSLYEKRPFFQNSVMKIVGNARGTPDISFFMNAGPNTGVCIYSTHGGVGSWKRSGGTSLASPALSGIINSANRRAQSSQEELLYIYTNALKNYHAYWHDIIEGDTGFPTLAGYDFATGLGTPLGYLGK